MVCLTCGRVSCTTEPFLDLSLSIPIQEKPPEPTPAEAMRAARSKAPPPPPPPVTTLEDCLSAFQAKEDLVGDDAYECEACAKDDAAAAQEGAPPSPTMRQRALKVLHVSKSPPVLTLHLKRFAAINGAMHKVDERVRFPSSVHVDMFPDAATSLEQLSAGAGRTSLRYELYGVVEHSGSYRDGHYIAYTRGGGPNSWHRFSDSKVSEVTEEEALAAQAFLLFFRCAAASS